MTQTNHHLYEFGEFRLDAQERLLSRGGTMIPLTPKSFELLLALVEQPGKLLDKETLLRTVWPDSFVEENNLADNIFKLRKALGDGENGQKFIETIPRRGYRFVAEVRQQNSSQAADRKASAAAAAQSIAVLPFTNISAEEENEYFCDGLTEELLNALAKIDELKVAARTSAFAFKGINVEAREIGRTLNVNTVLEGSVRKAGNRLRITAQLINVADGYHLWSERYDREMKDIFDVQDEITMAVVEALRIRLLSSDQASLTKRYTDNVLAYELYLKGRQQWYKFSPEGFAKAREYFEQAITEDSAFALAYMGIRDVYIAGGMFDLATRIYPLAKEKTEQALDLDSASGEARRGLAALRFFYEWDFAGAEQACLHAINLNPSSATAHELHALILLSQMRCDEALRAAAQALEIDPFSSASHNFQGMALLAARRDDEARQHLLQSLALDPGNYWAFSNLVDLYERHKNPAAAAQLRQQYQALIGRTEFADQIRHAMETAGYRDVLRVCLDALLHLPATMYCPPLEVACLYLRLGEKQNALQWLEKAYAERGIFMVFLRALPAWDDLRSESAFSDLLRRIGLPE